MLTMRRRVLAVITMMLCFVLLFTACGTAKDKDSLGETVEKPKQNDASGGTKSTDAAEDNEMLGNMYLTGLPIVKEPVTLTVAVTRASHQGPYSEMKLLKDLEKETNVYIEWREFTEDAAAEQINLMFASADYPDVMWRLVTDEQQLGYGQAGEILALNDLIDKYGPNWKKAFEEYPYAKKIATAPDGNIYSLPYIRIDEANSGYRDTWFINKVWLDNLGLDIPTTTEEYYHVLKAFKDGDPNQNGQPDEIPWTFLFYAYSKGHFDIFGSFGLLDFANHIAVEDGKVIFTALREENAEAIKYLHRLYADGLIDVEAFTQSNSQFLAKLKSETRIVGACHLWNGYNELGLETLQDEIYVPIHPLIGPSGEKPKIRQQTNTVERGFGTIFKTNPYPEITMRWLDAMATPEFGIQTLYGPFETCIKITDDGMYECLPLSGELKLAQAPLNFGPFYIPGDYIAKIIPDESHALRRKFYHEIYKQYAASLDEIYPPVFFTPEQIDERQKYETDIIEYVKRMHAKWIVEGGIDEDWNAFTKKTG